MERNHYRLYIVHLARRLLLLLVVVPVAPDRRQVIVVLALGARLVRSFFTSVLLDVL